MTTNPLAPTHRRGQQLQHTFQRPRRDKADPSVKVPLNQAGQHLVRGDRGGYRRELLQGGYWLHQAGQHLTLAALVRRCPTSLSMLYPSRFRQSLNSVVKFGSSAMYGRRQLRSTSSIERAPCRCR